MSLIALFLLIGCSDSEGGGENTERLTPAVEAVQAQLGSLPLTERLSGVVKANHQVEIYPEISAAVERVHVENGDQVNQGQPLVQLRDREFRERLKQAQAGYQIAVAQAKQAEARLQKIQTDLQRTRTLADKNLASPTELETIQTEAISAEADFELARARVEQAQATVDEREEALAQTVIRAPVSGTVGNRYAEIGMLVSSGTRLFTIGQLDSVTVEVVLTDRMLSYIQSGMRADILSEGLSFGSASARLTRISPFLHPVTHSTDAEIDMPNPEQQLRPGMFVTVDVFYGESDQATLIPLSALYENPASGATGVFVSRDSIVGEPINNAAAAEPASLTQPINFAFVPVQVIAKGRMHAGISGVSPGSWIVTIGQDLLGEREGNARVRKVNWEWVEDLQQMQREDLLEDIITRQREAARDTTT